MLTHIHIRNFTIVESLELEFGEGMSTLTGETGAGKSILLDALGLCLGDRADSDAIRAGADRAEINATFSIAADSDAARWLRDNELDSDGECLLRRIVQQNGRSKGFINATPVPVQSMRELGELLVDIHGQHAHQSLFRRDAQRQALDGFGAHEQQLQETAGLYQQLTEIQSAIARLDGGQGDYQDRKDLLRFQVDELAALELTAEGIAELDAEQRRLAAADNLLQTAQQVLAMLYEDEGSAQSALGQANSNLEKLLKIDPRLRETQEILASSLIQLEEGCDNLRRYIDSLELDPERLALVEQKISQLNDLARKHRIRLEELPDYFNALNEELAQLDGAEEQLATLRQQAEKTGKAYRAAAAKLSAARQSAATALSARVTGFVHELGMPGAEFSAQVSFSETAKPARHGLDHIEFQVRTNPGQPMGPLNRVASGGELSRIGLAIQVATAKTGHIPTLIFDEADVGIGGAIAEVVGQQLRQLGNDRQVLCVTHLPQVAAQAHQHYQVSKYNRADQTFTQVRWLEEEERVDEIARMLGGVEITPQTRSHAQEMLERAGNTKARTVS